MTTAVTAFLVCWALLAIAGNTPFGRLLHRVMVDIPARAASRGNVAIALVILVLVVLHLSAGSADPVRLLGLFAPDLAMWLISFEISAIVEAAASFGVAWAALRRINVRSVLAAHIARLWKRFKTRTKRARRPRRRDRVVPANDDEDGVQFALAS